MYYLFLNPMNSMEYVCMYENNAWSLCNLQVFIGS